MARALVLEKFMNYPNSDDFPPPRRTLHNINHRYHPHDFYQRSREFLEELIKNDPKNMELLKAYEKLISDYTELQKIKVAQNTEVEKLNIETRCRSRRLQYE